MRTGSVFREPNELWRYNIDKPDFVGGHIEGGHKEDKSFLNHFTGPYFQQARRSSSSPDG